MDITEELIHRFFKQGCTPEESSAVGDFFHQNPEELDKYISEKEWESFGNYEELDPSISRQMLDEIEQQIAINVSRCRE